MHEEQISFWLEPPRARHIHSLAYGRLHFDFEVLWFGLEHSGTLLRGPAADLSRATGWGTKWWASKVHTYKHILHTAPFSPTSHQCKLIKSQRSLQFKLYSHWSSLESVLAMWQKKLIYYYGKTTAKSWFRWVKCYSMATLLTAALLQVSYQIFPYCYHIIFTVEVLPTREIIVTTISAVWTITFYYVHVANITQ